MIDYNLEQELKSHLSQHEHLLWVGKPKTGIIFRPSDIFLIPFSLMWCGFAIFWEFSTIAMGAPVFFSLFGLPFVLIGLYITVGRFYIDARKRANTVYGVTADRIIIKSGVFSTSVESHNIRSLSNLAFTEKRDGSGTITLAAVDFRYTMMQGTEWPGNKQPPRLDHIQDVKAVYDKIISAQRQQ